MTEINTVREEENININCDDFCGECIPIIVAYTYHTVYHIARCVRACICV